MCWQTLLPTPPPLLLYLRGLRMLMCLDEKF
jgi:hypothetical protein